MQFVILFTVLKPVVRICTAFKHLFCGDANYKTPYHKIRDTRWIIRKQEGCYIYIYIYIYIYLYFTTETKKVVCGI